MSDTPLASADWSKPRPVDGVTAAFGVSSTRDFLPPMAELPEEFRRDRHSWCRVMDRWFFSGVPGHLFRARPGIVWKEAIAHLGAVMRSFDPQHEHKIAGCAYLASLWFEDVADVDKPAPAVHEAPVAKVRLGNRPRHRRGGL